MAAAAAEGAPLSSVSFGTAPFCAVATTGLPTSRDAKMVAAGFAAETEAASAGLRLTGAGGAATDSGGAAGGADLVDAAESGTTGLCAVLGIGDGNKISDLSGPPKVAAFQFRQSTDRRFDAYACFFLRATREKGEYARSRNMTSSVPSTNSIRNVRSHNLNDNPFLFVTIDV